jgi:hypothetical protein
MKKVVSFVMALGFLAISSAAFAHPPVSIAITYNKETKIADAVIVHPVSNPATHYIYKVDVGLNGKEIVTHAISLQENNNEQHVSYRLPDAKAGDKVSIEGYCNLSGSLTQEITVQ